MTYVPQNTNVFLNAFNGAYAGMVSFGRSLISPSATSKAYTDPANVAIYFAEEVDTLNAGVSQDSVFVEAVRLSSMLIFQAGVQNVAPFNTAAGWLGPATDVLAAALAGDTAVLGQGVVPPVPPSGGSNSVFIYDPTAASSSGNVYKTFLGAYTAARAFGDGALIIIGPNGGTCVSGAIGAINLSGITLSGLPSAATTAFTFQTGTTVANGWLNVQYLAIASTSAAAVQTLANGAGIPFGSGTGLSSATSPFFALAAGATAVLLGYGPICELGDGTNPIATINGTATLGIFIGDFGELETGATTGTGDLTVLTSASSYGGVGTQGSGLTSTFAATGAFARGWADNSANIEPGGTAATIVTSVTVTPKSTGKFRVTCTAVVQNATATFNEAIISLGHGPTAGTVNYIGNPCSMNAGNVNQQYVPVSVVADYDQLTAPVIFPPGTPVQFNAILTLAPGTAGVGVLAHNCQLEVQEVA